MSFQIMINVIIALMWMFLTNAWSFGSFVSGFAIGAAILFLVRGFFTHRFYLIGIYAIFKLILIFIKELILSSVQVLSQLLQPKLSIQPGIFSLEIELEKDWEITVLSCLITLTPGTLVVDISPDNKILYIHAMDLPDVETAKKDIEGSFIKAIQEVSR
ncbi:Na+/H+ antiporter subunit E [Alteribacillus sp. HJP-4]|uniref:Na+/H+ antiporter subunit E n=1 Tax=Alteribacillus sp. HJP-4 TaxID=2775394 RepID=UPI0035CD3A7B